MLTVRENELTVIACEIGEEINVSYSPCQVC